MEEVEVPAGFEAAGYEVHYTEPTESDQERKQKRSFKWVYGGAAAIILGLVVGILVDNQQQKKPLQRDPS